MLLMYIAVTLIFLNISNFSNTVAISQTIIILQNYSHSILFTSDYSQKLFWPNRCMPSSIDNHLAIAIDVAISSIYRQLHTWTRTIYVLPGPFMFWHKWSGGTIYDNINGPGDHLCRTLMVPPDHLCPDHLCRDSSNFVHQISYLCGYTYGKQ